MGMATAWLPVSVHCQADPSKTDSPVVVELHPDLQETVYRITEKSCAIRWTVYHSQVNKGVVQHQATCDLPLSQQAPLIARLLESVMKDDETARTFHTLSLGRLNSFPGLPARLAILAKQSPLWDLRRGRVSEGRTSQWLVQLANQGRFYDEWQGVFQRFNRHIEVSSVEHVAFSKAGELPYFKELQDQGIAPADRVPYDCQVWLAVTGRGGAANR
jgi:hypothetical protein